MKLTIKQTIAIDYLEDNTTTEVLFGGGAGGGKSALGCYWQIKRRLKYPGTRGLIGRSKRSVLKDTTLKTFFEIAKLQGIEKDKHYRVTSSNDKENPNCIMFYNSSLIYLRDLFLYPADPEFDDLGSLEITDAFIDECNQIVEKGKGIVKSRIRFKLDENNIIPKMLMTCNPAKNWTYRQFYQPSRKKELPEYRQFVQSLLNDNPYISKHYKTNLLTLNSNSRERLLYGNWEYDDDPSALIDIDSISDYFKPTHIKAEGDKFMTIDVARKGKDATVFRIWHGWLCISRYSIAKGPLTEVVSKAKTLQSTYKVPLTHVIADEDGVGGGVVDFLGCKGFVNGSRALNGANFNNLKSQCGYKISEKIVKREVGEICRDSTIIDRTSEEMEQVKQKDIDKDGKIALVGKDIVKQNIGRSPDDWDSIMMRYYFELTPVFFVF